MTLFFENMFGEKREISRPDTMEDGRKEMMSFLDKHDFISPYWRANESNGDLWIDVGSHSEFFWIHDDNRNLTIKDFQEGF